MMSTYAGPYWLCLVFCLYSLFHQWVLFRMWCWRFAYSIPPHSWPMVIQVSYEEASLFSIQSFGASLSLPLWELFILLSTIDLCRQAFYPRRNPSANSNPVLMPDPSFSYPNFLASPNRNFPSRPVLSLVDVFRSSKDWSVIVLQPLSGRGIPDTSGTRHLWEGVLRPIFWSPYIFVVFGGPSGSFSSSVNHIPFLEYSLFFMLISSPALVTFSSFLDGPEIMA